MLRLIQNLEIEIKNDSLAFRVPDIGEIEEWPFNSGREFVKQTDRYLRHIEWFCIHLTDSVQLQYLDIDLSLACKFSDIDYMACLLEPFKMLRGIRNAHITVKGFQFEKDADVRWRLTEEYTDYLERIFLCTEGTPTPPPEDLQIFDNCYVDPSPELEEDEIEWRKNSSWQGEDLQNMRDYLRDVYGTEDEKALHGDLPERWQIWLNSDVSLLSLYRDITANRLSA